MAGVFISYRERDSKAWALSLRDHLVSAFGEEKIFLDKDTLKAGKWKDQIEQALGDCNVVLVLIGRNWLDAKNEQGEQRLMLESDVHRREIALALARLNVTVIPVLVDGASMPRALDLPENIQGLIQQQSRAISDSAAHRKVDLDGLIADIRRTGGFGPIPGLRPDPKPELSTPSAYSKMTLGALGLVGLVVSLTANKPDNDELLGAAVMYMAAVGLAIKGHMDIKAGKFKGRGWSITALTLSIVMALGSLSQLAGYNNAQSPPVAPAFVPAPAAPPVTSLADQPPQSRPVVPAPKTKRVEPKPAPPVLQTPEPDVEPDPPPQTASSLNLHGVWQDSYDVNFIYVFKQEGAMVHIQEFNALGALTFAVTGTLHGKKLDVEHPMLRASLAVTNNGGQLTGNVVYKGNGYTKTMLLHPVDLNTLSPQWVAFLRPMIE